MRPARVASLFLLAAGPAGVRYLLVYLTSEGKLTDYDVVTR